MLSSCFPVVIVGSSGFMKMRAIEKKMFWTATKNIFTLPQREILNPNVLFLYVNLSWNIFFEIDISAGNANLMLFSKWNDSFKLKQFGMNQYLFQMPKWDSAQNVKICHIHKSRSKLQELFFALYTHIYRISKIFYAFHPKARWKWNAKILQNWDVVPLAEKY